MCFSAPVSFVAGAIMTCVGIASLWAVKSKPWMMFAAIPLIFGIQQFTEGFLWLTLSYHLSCIIANIAALDFLVTAMVLWPVWIPCSIYLLESEPSMRQSILKLLVFLGGLFSLSALFVLTFYPIQLSVYQFSIVYDIGGAFNFHVESMLILYCIPVLLPFFLSSHHQLKIFGMALIASLAISMYFKYQQLISVWCFMAAALSFIIFILVKQANNQVNHSTPG